MKVVSNSNIGADDMLYTEVDLENSMSKIETIDFHQEVEVDGVRFWCYHAGHVLGAAMFMIEIAGVRVKIKSDDFKNRFYSILLSFKVLYTGDFSRVEDRHLMAAELPSIKPDVLIIVINMFSFFYQKNNILLSKEATYGVNLHEPREEREKRFTDTVHEIVSRGFIIFYNNIEDENKKN